MKDIIIFASGAGTNAEAIIEYFQEKQTARVSHVFSNVNTAKVLQRAKNHGIKALHFDKTSFFRTNEVLHVLVDAQPDLIVLAGFLWLFPQKILQAFPNKIINIHPSLLPKYGGKGMYGMNVHEEVIKNKESESGITIHYVNEQYDQGAIIRQEKVSLDTNDTASTLAKKIQTLEHVHFPRTVEEVLYKTEV